MPIPHRIFKGCFAYAPMTNTPLGLAKAGRRAPPIAEETPVEKAPGVNMAPSLFPSEGLVHCRARREGRAVTLEIDDLRDRVGPGP